MKSLLECKMGQYQTIVGLSCGSEKIKRRLLELGFTRGEKVRVVRKSLLGKVRLVEIRGYTLSLRQDITKGIIVGDKYD